MAAYTKAIPRFLNAGRSSQNGLAGFLQRLVGGWGIKASGSMGTIAVASGQTSVVVSDAGVQAGDLILATVMTKGTNFVSYVGVTSVVAGTSFTLNVSADPGAGGVVLAFIRLPGNLLFSS